MRHSPIAKRIVAPEISEQLFEAAGGSGKTSAIAAGHIEAGNIVVRRHDLSVFLTGDV